MPATPGGKGESCSCSGGKAPSYPYSYTHGTRKRTEMIGRIQAEQVSAETERLLRRLPRVDCAWSTEYGAGNKAGEGLWAWQAA